MSYKANLLDFFTMLNLIMSFNTWYSGQITFHVKHTNKVLTIIDIIFHLIWFYEYNKHVYAMTKLTL